MPDQILNVNCIETERVERHPQRLSRDLVVYPRYALRRAWQQELPLERSLRSDVPESPQREPVIDRIQDGGVEVGEQVPYQRPQVLLGTADFLRRTVEKMEDVWPI